MSGFEVVGVVLGTLPLVISAMEHYAEGITTAKRYWKYKSEMRSLILQINTERVIFINTLEQLLTGIVRVEHMSDFLANPRGPLWKSSEVETKLKDRLRAVYELYLGNIQGMELSLAKIMEKLALGADGKPQFTDPNAFKQEYRRLKFCISRSEYVDLMGNLKSYNQALTRLTKQSIDLEPTRTETKRHRPNFSAFQNYARNLYSSLRSSWGCACPEHAVNLRLENRSEALEEERILEKTPFRVVFSYTADSHQRKWKEADIRYIIDSPKQTLPSVSIPSRATQPIAQRRVHFQEIEVASQKHTTVVTTTTALASASNSDTAGSVTTTITHIEDLCKAIARLQQPQRDLCIGYLLDSLKRKHGVYLLGSHMTQQPQWTTFSLGEVLSRNPAINRRLTQHDKLRIAVDLASSVLQLYKTPWLDEEWTREDVVFIHRPGAPPASIYEHPYVCRTFVSHGTVGSNQSQPKPLYRVIRNQTLFTLGILLIELWYGKTMDELQQPSDRECQGTPGVAWCTAERLVENEIEFDAGKRYSDAVRRCIRCDFDRKDLSLESESFQCCVYDGVVALLEKTLQQFSSLD